MFLSITITTALTFPFPTTTPITMEMDPDELLGTATSITVRTGNTDTKQAQTERGKKRKANPSSKPKKQSAPKKAKGKEKVKSKDDDEEAEVGEEEDEDVGEKSDTFLIAPDGGMIRDPSNPFKGNQSINRKDMDFEIIIDNPDTLRAWLKLASAHIDRFNVRVEATTEFTGLSLFQYDASNICVTDARLPAIVYLSKPPEGVKPVNSFCVLADTLKIYLRRVVSKHRLHLIKAKGDSRIIGQVYDGDGAITDISFDLNTIECDAENLYLPEVEYPYIFKLMTATIKTVVQDAKDLKVEAVTFCIDEPKLDEEEEIALQGVVRNEKLKLLIHIDIHSNQGNFRKTLRSLPPSIASRGNDAGEEEDEDGEPAFERERMAAASLVRETYSESLEFKKSLVNKFKGSYGRIYLEKIIQNMDEKHIEVSIGNDVDGETMPITIKYSFGTKNAYVKFFLECKMAEEDEQGVDL